MVARIICYAFSAPVSPFVSQVNRATDVTLRQRTTQEETPQTPRIPGLRTKREHFLDRLLALPSRADIHDLELRLGERMESLAVRFDRAFDTRVS